MDINYTESVELKKRKKKKICAHSTNTSLTAIFNAKKRI